MIMVLGLHANFKALGVPEISDDSLTGYYRIIFECICIVCVNVFVLISGWFGIKGSFHKLNSFAFQCVFILSVIYSLNIILGYAQFNLKGLGSCICLIGNGWFVISYIGLYLLAPIINNFILSSSRELIRKTIILYWLFIMIWGWVGGNKNFNNGYSTLVFIGLYLIGRYLRLYGFKKLKYSCLFLTCTLVNTLLTIAIIKFNNGVGVGKIINYINPIVVLQSISLLLYFSSVPLGSKKYINWIASSAFAVYLFQDVSPFNEKLYNSLSQSIFESSNGFSYMINITALILIFFICGIIIDKLRIIVWNIILRQRK